MKKIISLALTLVLMFSVFALVSCNGGDNTDDTLNAQTAETLAGKTPEQLYEASQEKLKEATEYSITTTQVITMSGMTMNQTVINKISGDNCYVKMTNDTTPMTNMEVWYVNGMMYMNLYNGKIKGEYDKEQYMQEYMGKDPSESTLLDIPESWYKDIQFKKDGDAWMLEFVISAEKYNELFENIDLGGSIAGDVVYKLYFDTEGNMDKLTTSFDMTVQGVSAHCDQVSNIVVENVTVTAPADADSYQTTTLQ